MSIYKHTYTNTHIYIPKINPPKKTHTIKTKCFNRKNIENEEKKIIDKCYYQKKIVQPNNNNKKKKYLKNCFEIEEFPMDNEIILYMYTDTFVSNDIDATQLIQTTTTTSATKGV